MDLRTFAAAEGDLVTIVMWDADSLDVATKRSEDRVQHPVRYTVR